MKKSLSVQVILALLLCAVFAQSAAAIMVVRSQKPVDTTQPGIGRYIEAYYGSDNPQSPRYYLGTRSEERRVGKECRL